MGRGVPKGVRSKQEGLLSKNTKTRGGMEALVGPMGQAYIDHGLAQFVRSWSGACYSAFFRWFWEIGTTTPSHCLVLCNEPGLEARLSDSHFTSFHPDPRPCSRGLRRAW